MLVQISCFLAGSSSLLRLPIVEGDREGQKGKGGRRGEKAETKIRENIKL
jgi:hypothetical protein